jgi:hypothetical protein
LTLLRRVSGTPLFLAVALPALAQNTLVVESVATQTTYCASPFGGVVLSTRLTVNYRNNLGQPVLLPVFSRVARWALFRDERHLEMGLPLRKDASSLEPMFDGSKRNLLWLDPRWFEVIQPGGVAQRVLTIPLVGSGPRDRTLSDGSYYLVVRIEPRLADRKSDEALAEHWKAQGKLWIDPITLPPVRLQIQKPSAPEPCNFRID